MIAVISGASSGIGREFVYQVDELNFDEIWIIARRLDRLKTIETDLITPTRIFALDLLDDKSFKLLQSNFERYEAEIGLLVNSAGVGCNDYFEKTSLMTLDDTIGLNISAPTRLIKASLAYMKEGSVIINVASVAGFIPQPKFAQYAASKSYMISLSRSLNRELRDRKIHVAALCPNPVATEFGKDYGNSVKSYANEDIHKLVKVALEKASHKDIITVHPAASFMRVVGKILPNTFIMWVEKILNMY